MREMKHVLHAAALVAAFGAGSAAAINKCVVDGKPVFQDAPCDEQRETAAQTRARELRNEAYHRELDRLAAQGVGLQRETPQAPAPQAKRDAGESDMFQPNDHGGGERIGISTDWASVVSKCICSARK